MMGLVTPVCSCDVVVIPAIYVAIFLTVVSFNLFILWFYADINIIHLAERDRSGSSIRIQNIKYPIQVSSIEWMIGAEFLC